MTANYCTNCLPNSREQGLWSANTRIRDKLDARFRQLFQDSIATNNYAQVTSKYSSVYY